MTYGSSTYGNATYGSTSAAVVEVAGTATATYTSDSNETATTSVTGTATPTYTSTGKYVDFVTGTASPTYTAASAEEGISGVDGTATAAYTSASAEVGIATPEGTAEPTYTATSDETGSVSVDGTAGATYDSTTAVTFPLATEGVLWYINRLDQPTATALNGETSTYPNITIGEETTFSFYIKHDSGYPAQDAVGDAEDRYGRLKEWSKYAGYAATNTTLSSVYFREHDYPNSDIDSLLVSIEPGDGVAEARGVWGVITGIDDSTEIFGAVARVDVTVFVLAQYDDYADEAAVRADLEV